MQILNTIVWNKFLINDSYQNHIVYTLDFLYRIGAGKFFSLPVPKMLMVSDLFVNFNAILRDFFLLTGRHTWS